MVSEEEPAGPNKVVCSGCGEPRPARLAEGTSRPPCPACGATAITVQVSAAVELNMAVSVSATLAPGDQGRDWRRRWEEAQRELAAVSAPHAEGLSGDAIHAAASRLQSFFIQTYHLKDALKADAAAHGVSPKVIEAAITTDPDLALLADLANLDKHFTLTNPPRSGDVPVVARVEGVSPGSGAGGWRLAAGG